jgi:erythromycin esterase-like protein
MEIKQVRPAHADSIEYALEQTGIDRGIITFKNSDARKELKNEAYLERYIGVIYSPETEMISHYSQSFPAREYDAILFHRETNALTPL